MPDAGHEETDVLLARIERKVEKVYRKAATETRNKLNEYLKQYKADDERKREAVKSGDLSEEAYQKWRKDHMIKGKQYQDMLDVLADDYVNADKIAMSIVNEHTPEAYAINRNYAAFEIEKGLQIDTSFTLYDRQTVERLIHEKEILLPKPRVDIPKDRRWNRQHIRDQITQGVLQGDSIPNIAKRLQKVAQMDKAAAIRNARTAVTGAENAGRVDGYKRAQEMGIDLQQEWLASLDMKTRHSHRQMDGVKVNVGQKFPNGLRYPGDPEGPPEEVYNCRCTLVAALTGFDASGAPRKSRLGGMSYEEWKNEKQQERKQPESYYKPLDANRFVNDAFSAEDVNRINARFKELDRKYHAKVTSITTTLERDQHEWDLYHENYIKHLLEENPRMRKSTAENRTIQVLGERPVKASVFKGGDYMMSTGEMTINNDGIGYGISVSDDIERRKKSFARYERRLANGRNPEYIYGNAGEGMESTFIHEYGHAIDATYRISEDERFRAFYNSLSKEEIQIGVSDYAATNEQEFIAECFTESFMAETQGDISKRFMSLLGEIIG